MMSLVVEYSPSSPEPEYLLNQTQLPLPPTPPLDISQVFKPKNISLRIAINVSVRLLLLIKLVRLRRTQDFHLIGTTEPIGESSHHISHSIQNLEIQSFTFGNEGWTAPISGNEYSRSQGTNNPHSPTNMAPVEVEGSYSNERNEAICENYSVFPSLPNQEMEVLPSGINECVASLARDVLTDSIDGTSQHIFQGQMDVVNIEKDYRNASHDARNCDHDENNLHLSFQNRNPQSDNLIRKKLKIAEASLLSITSTLPQELVQNSGPHFNGAKNPICEQIQYYTQNCLINDATIKVTEPKDAQIDRYVIANLTSHKLLEGQPSIAPQSCESEAVDLENILEEEPLVNQHTKYCDDNNNFVNGKSYHQDFEMGPNGTSLHSEVEIDGKGKKEIPRDAILKLWSTGMTLVAAAKEQEVSKSTMKRWCRVIGISKWRSNKRMKQDQSNQNNPKTKSSSSEPSQLNLGNPTNSGSVSSTKKRKYASDSIQDGTSTIFTVKAKYKEDNIKFNFLATWSFDQLKEEVESRLNLDSSKFKISYIDDDDNDSVMITCDSDLQLFLNNLEQSKTNKVRLLIVERS